MHAILGIYTAVHACRLYMELYNLLNAQYTMLHITQTNLLKKKKEKRKNTHPHKPNLLRNW